MRIKSIKYSQFADLPNKWEIEETTLGDINLIVGKNASGKTRTINVINSLGKLLSGKRKPTLKSGDYTVVFEDEENGTLLKYKLVMVDGSVVKEELESDGKKLLKRGKNGSGKIYAKKLDVDIEFQVPQNELASTNRRDSIQHPFFEGLFNWGQNQKIYRFSTSLGKERMMLLNEKESTSQGVNVEAGENAIHFFERGKKEFGNKFLTSIKKDMVSVGFDVKEVGIGKPSSLIIDQFDVYNLAVTESELASPVDQNEMSQGMFRTLSLIIQMNYFTFAKEDSCILIDDIGEGLDYDRSTNLINLLINKAEKASFQLIMSTNDRFVMNNVPLKYWSVIDRMKNSVKIRNYQNSKKVFDEFEYTGLNNFDFFSKNFFEKGLRD